MKFWTITRTVFVSGLEWVSMESSYYVENLNGLVSGFEEHSVIDSFLLVVFSQSLGGNSNWSKGIRITMEVIHSFIVEFFGRCIGLI